MQGVQWQTAVFSFFRTGPRTGSPKAAGDHGRDDGGKIRRDSLCRFRRHGRLRFLHSYGVTGETQAMAAGIRLWPVVVPRFHEKALAIQEEVCYS